MVLTHHSWRRGPTYAVDPEPYGPPWLPWQEIGTQEAAARGIFAPPGNLSDGPSDTVLLAPGDMRGTRLILERAAGYCTGIDGRDRPNLACVGCDLPIRTRMDDCGCWQVVRLLPQAIVRLPGPTERPVMDWPELLATGALWQRLGEYRDIPAGVAIAHVVVAARGCPVEEVPGSVAELLSLALAELLPAGEGTKRLDLAGPGLSEPAAELVLVHPQTGEMWQPSGGVTVPVEATGQSWSSRPIARACQRSADCQRAWSGIIHCRHTRGCHSGRLAMPPGTRWRGCRRPGTVATGDLRPRVLTRQHWILIEVANEQSSSNKPIRGSLRPVQRGSRG